ncbi:hypothetical protein HYFRA_00012412 [Hymenoscyphus fraxineus]|uniref:Meiotically up-regulated protein n=1 Tax=Hymenoscyphus fraxineus TaxID=746836 RepID=A0A9N9PYT7_9HELO|nr:hypothetical protein HYFRA_00012412 [Hymenoscyphus fraxineus]
MSSHDMEADAARRDYRAPYSHDHPIPTVQGYRQHRDELKDQHQKAEDSQHTEEDDSKVKRAFNAVKSIVHNEDKQEAEGNPYPTANRNEGNEGNEEMGDKDSGIPEVPSVNGNDGQSTKQDDNVKSKEDNKKSKKDQQNVSATEKAAGQLDPKRKRKDMKHNKRDDGGREVTDPVTHLPLVIRDSTAKDLRRAPENEPGPDEGTKRANTGLSSGSSKDSEQLDRERRDLQDGYDGMQKMFPPPAYEDTKVELMKTYQFAFAIATGVALVLGMSLTLLFFAVTKGSWGEKAFSKKSLSAIAIFLSLVAGGAFAVITGLQGWLGKKVESIWEDEVWDAARVEEEEFHRTNERLPESVAWMNSLLASVWPLINPDLFASVVDMLEDVMQASLPKVVRMVSIDDLGQGSEAIRILGVRWLPTGAADQSVDEEGNLKEASDKDANDRGAPGQGEQEDHEKKTREDVDTDASKKQDEKKQKEAEQQAIREGMEAEQGDFVNMELAFAYRARSSGKSIKSKAKNAHLYLKFYLPGGAFVPVWVELRGIIGTMRLRLQLCPDPPFFSLCTMTFVGQPKADLSCVPLSRHLPNLMNVPLISSFVQSSIDAALADYVAPKSLTIDLKEMLVGDDFKKDAVARGVIVIFIQEARDFKEGDGGLGPLGGSSDSYITCSWGKFGKTISSTRVIESDQRPRWEEWAYMLVSPEELNADEKLRLQLWDSDKYTADDDLGRVEVDLKELMHSSKTKNRMCDRVDRFMGQDAGEKMPGTLSWSVGYYSKIRITEGQLSKQTEDDKIRSKKDLKEHVAENAKRKLREATAHDESKEINQQKAQDYQERENALICSSPPDPEYPSGILSIQIHNITGLQVEAMNIRDKQGDVDREDQAEKLDDVPSSYCSIILNHTKIYRTRTKPKNAKPFFNASTERFIRDWRTAEVLINVRDSREKENDPLIGIVYLPLDKVFSKRSQVMDLYPLVGGIGFGRARISMVFRSVELKLPKELLGWDYGTLEIKAPIKAIRLPEDLSTHRLKIRSNMARSKFTANNGEWTPKHSKGSSFIAIRKRYAIPLVVEFRKSSVGPDSTPAFAVFWLKDIADEEEQTITLQVWKGGKENLKRATTSAGYQGLEENEEAIGEIELTMKFWRGLSGYHKRYANKAKETDMRNVMEALDTVNDEIASSGSSSDESSSSSSSSSPSPSRNKKLTTHTNQDTDEESSSSQHKKTKNPIKKAKQIKNSILEGENDEEEPERGPVSQLRDYNSHHRQLHRKHRGVMQWRAARTAGWAVDKCRRGKGALEGMLEHGGKEPGVETEV